MNYIQLKKLKIKLGQTTQRINQVSHKKVNQYHTKEILPSTDKWFNQEFKHKVCRTSTMYLQCNFY